MTRTLFAPIAAALLAAFTALGGCSSRTNVSATGNVPGFYSHVYVTAQAVWFNQSATAGPTDGGWAKFSLSTPVTVDLVADSNGSFGFLINDLKLTPGTYSQVRVIPVDPSTPLTTSAQTAGAIYNCEADYIDAQGVTQQLPLELLNPNLGIGIVTSVSVPVGNVGKALAANAVSNATTTTTGSTTNSGPFANTSGTSTLGTVASATNTTTLTQVALAVDAARDLSAFNVGTENGTPTGTTIGGVMWSSHVAAYDLSKAGGIQGTLTLTNLTNISAASGVPDIQVSAEALTPDNSRWYVVASTPVASDGTFTLYPLAANRSTYTYYDLVIHGPGIATIIIKGVYIPPYNCSSSGTSASSSSYGSSSSTNCTSLASNVSGLLPATTTTGTTTTGTTTTGLTNATSTTPSDLAPVQPTNLVSIGTLIPRQATAYTANIAQSANQQLPAGAAVAFYQTLSGSGQVPYVIQYGAIDPFNQNLAIPQGLSTGTIDSGSYVSSGATITVTSAAPQESVNSGVAGTYQVAATAPLYNDGTLGITVTAPGSSSSGTSPPPQTVTISKLSLATGEAAATLAATVQAAGTRNNQGELLLSNNGQLIATASLNNVLAAGGGTVQLTDLPGGSSSSLFYVTVRTWSSSNPSGTVTTQWFDTPVDLRSASSASITLTLN
jgi:hypothetical protein